MVKEMIKKQKLGIILSAALRRKSVGEKRQIYAWALYDWANSAFATVVMAGFFPMFFRQYWSITPDATLDTLRLGVANTVASLLIAVSAPLLGAFADFSRRKKEFLLVFAWIGISMTGGLYFVPRGRFFLSLVIYVLATVGFLGGNVFYDSLLLDVAPEGQLDRVSALGYALGYIGGGLLFAGCVWGVLSPATFGFVSSARAVRVSFLSVALWWGIFTLPLFLFVHARSEKISLAGRRYVRTWGHQLLATLKRLKGERNILLFLLGYWLYIDGVGTVIRMAVDYGMAMGLRPRDLILALLVTQFVGFPATLAFGKVGSRWGAKTGIIIGLAGYLAIVVGSLFITRGRDFMVLAIAVGLVQGGVQSLSRSLFASLVPAGMETASFGVFNMLGRFAAVWGPTLMGMAAFLTGQPRMGILSVGALFIGGIVFLLFVKETGGKI